MVWLNTLRNQREVRCQRSLADIFLALYGSNHEINNAKTDRCNPRVSEIGSLQPLQLKSLPVTGRIAGVGADPLGTSHVLGVAPGEPIPQKKRGKRGRRHPHRGVPHHQARMVAWNEPPR